MPSSQPGLVFTKGLRLSRVLGLTVGSELRLLFQLSFALNLYSQKVTFVLSFKTTTNKTISASQSRCSLQYSYCQSLVYVNTGYRHLLVFEPFF